MGREIYVAYGFQTGHHYCGEQELKSYSICYRSSGHICVLWALKNYGSAAIKISLFQTSRQNDFLYIQVWAELTWASVIRDITKLDKEVFHNFVSLAPQDFLSAFVKIIFWFI